MVELTSPFKLDYEDLDQDHQRLADIVNLIVAAIDADEGEKCEDLVNDFVKSAKGHFAREEALLTKAGFPNVARHHAHHQSLNTKMEHLVEFAKNAADNQLARDSLRKELVFFLMDDVITADMDFKTFFEEQADKGET